MANIPFIGTFTEARELRVNAQKLVNLFPVVEGGVSKSRVALYSTPGLKPYKSVGLGPCRSNGVVFKNKAYFVSGKELISFDSSGNTVSVGFLNTTSGRVVIDVGRNQIGLTDGVNGYYYDGTTFGAITSGSFPVCNWIVCIRGFWVANQAGTDTFYVSSVGDITTWSALNFASAERRPDITQALAGTGSILWCLGETSMEAFTLTGNSYFPFEPNLSVVINDGIHAPYSLTASGDSIFWLAKTENGGFAVMRGSITGGIQKVSNVDIESQIDKLAATVGTISDAVGTCISDKSSMFYVLTFPFCDVTWVLDITTGTWHQRKSPGMGRWRVGGHVFFNNHHIVGDYASSQFYTLDSDYYLDGGYPIERTLRTQAIFDPEGNRALHHAYIEAEYAPGVGVAYGKGSDPVCRIRWSDDGGYAWSNEILLGIGKEGERARRVKASRLGMARSRTYEFFTAEPVPITILNAYGVVK
jgi:hypothetical protein